MSKKILDTSAVICTIIEAECPNIINNCIKSEYKVAITQTVMQEIKDNSDTYDKFRDYLESIKIEKCPQILLNKLKKRYPELHDGELSVIGLGIVNEEQNEKYWCILDDKIARKRANEINLRYTGFVGLTLWQKGNGDICERECLKIYENIKKSSFRISDKILDGLIK